jgi:hypothetical protein
MRLGFEFAIEREVETALGVKSDSAGREGVFTEESSWALVPKLTHTMTLREDRFPRVEGSRELVGGIGLSFERTTETEDKAKNTWMQLQRKQPRIAGAAGRVGQWFGANPDAQVCAAIPEKDKEVHLTLEYKMDGDIVLGALVIEEPSLEVKIQLADKDGSTTSGQKGDLEFALAAVFRGAEWGENGVAAGITVTREKKEATADQQCGPRPRSHATVEPIDPVAVTRPRADASASPQPVPDPASETRPRADATADQTQRPGVEGEWKVEWRIGTEKMPLMDLLRGVPGVIRSIRDAITGS